MLQIKKKLPYWHKICRYVLSIYADIPVNADIPDLKVGISKLVNNYNNSDYKRANAEKYCVFALKSKDCLADRIVHNVLIDAFEVEIERPPKNKNSIIQKEKKNALKFQLVVGHRPKFCVTTK